MNLSFEEKGERAFYNPLSDRVTMPDIEKFESEYAYMATLFMRPDMLQDTDSRP